MKNKKIVNIETKRKKETRDKLMELDTEAVVRAAVMIGAGSDEVLGVNHSFTKNSDIEELEKHREYMAELREKAMKNLDMGL